MKLILKRHLLDRPYNLFLLTALFLLIVSFIILGQSKDIYLDTTYFFIPTVHLLWILTSFFLLGWTIYKLTDRRLLTNRLTWLHVVTTLAFLIFIWVLWTWHDSLFPPTKTYLAYRQRRTMIIAPAWTIFGIGQIAFFINLIGRRFKRRA